jgi:hypothetical protein
VILARYRYQGQPARDWPTWLVCRNYAAAEDGSFLIVHRFLDELRAPAGHTIGLTSTQEIVLLAD